MIVLCHMFTLLFPKTQQGASLNLESVLAAATKHQNEGRYAEPLDIERFGVVVIESLSLLCCCWVWVAGAAAAVVAAAQVC